MLRKMIDFRFALSAAMLYLCQIFLWAVDPEPVEIPGVANAFLVTEQILSGSEPSGIITFAALREMGVSVVVSVDGRRPDVDAAKRHGLRYIHLPIGYDDVPTERQAQLLRAVCLLGKEKNSTCTATMENIEAQPPSPSSVEIRKHGRRRRLKIGCRQQARPRITKVSFVL